MALAPRRRVRNVWRYLRAEKRTLRQGFVALLISTAAGFVAGFVLSVISDTLKRLPGLFILIPASVAMRGVIFGALGARLGTSTHAGLFEVTRARTGLLYQNVVVATTLTFTASLYIALLARGSALLFGLESIRLLDLITISVVGAALASVALLAMSVGLAILSYRKGYDLDAVATPLITATGDMVSIPMLYVATFITHVRWVSTTVALACIAAAILAVVRAVRLRLPLAKRILLESIPVILLTPFFDILAGTVVEARVERFVALPGLLLLIPVMVSNIGAIGGILSSRLSSKLQVGLISPRALPEGPVLLDTSLVIAFALFVFTLIGSAGFAISALAGFAHPGAGVMILGALLAGLLASIISIVAAYYVAILTSHFGLDPDNHSVPFITSAMDLTGVVVFLFVLSLLGVAVHA